MTTDVTREEPFQQGDEFLQYRIGSLLGRGGHAFVYAGEHRYMERPVAIKVIPAPREVNSEIHKRAQLEAQILSQLEHPNVVKIYDAGVTSAGVIYIVMEMLEGWTLRAALKTLRAFTIPETLHVGLQIASAVQMAHAQRAIHRDLKPENVFILPGNVVKVLDFGITKLLGTNMAMTTQPHLIRGTPQYMSPEHMEGRSVTVRSDIYALGSVLYELLATMAPALIGLQEVSSYAIGYSQIHRMPPRLDEFVPGVPRYVAGSIQRMLAKTPGERPASMREVTDELQAIQTRFAVESPLLAVTLRELWRAPLLAAPGEPSGRARSGTGTLVLASHAATIAPTPRSEPQRTRPVARAGPKAMAATTGFHSSANALLVAPKTYKTGPERNIAPVSNKPVQASDAVSLRLVDRRSSSAPVPVTLARGRTRTPSHTTSFLIVAVVLGSIIGYGALLSLQRGQWASQSQNVSASPAVAASFTLQRGAADVPSMAPGASSTRSGVERAPVIVIASAADPLGAALANDRASMNPASSENTSRPPLRALREIHASESHSGTARMRTDVSQKRGTARPAATAGRSAQPDGNRDRLIFGAEDLAW